MKYLQNLVRYVLIPFVIYAFIIKTGAYSFAMMHKFVALQRTQSLLSSSEYVPFKHLAIIASGFIICYLIINVFYDKKVAINGGIVFFLFIIPVFLRLCYLQSILSTNNSIERVNFKYFELHVYSLYGLFLVLLFSFFNYWQHINHKSKIETKDYETY